MTLYLLKVHLQTFLSVSITQKCQILSCDTLVANERYIEQDSIQTASFHAPTSPSIYQHHIHLKIEICC